MNTSANPAVRGLLVMAYGTPSSLDQVEAYYTHIRRGRAPSPEQLSDLVRRYQAIGGVSPLTQITEAQAAGIGDFLNRDGAQTTYRVYLGMKHAHPFIGDVVKKMHQDGIEEAVTLVLAPHYSTMSVATYQKSADEAAAEVGGPNLTHIDSWHLHDGFLKVLTERVQTALAQFDHPSDVMVVFSAHSLPERILQMGDPYQDQLHATGDAVAKRLNLAHHTFAWQSAGRTQEKWLGPDILEVLGDLQSQGYRDIVVCPAGFVSDHLEVLYDVDIECQARARELGVKLVRTESLNADPAFLAALADVVRETDVVRPAGDKPSGNKDANDRQADNRTENGASAKHE